MAQVIDAGGKTYTQPSSVGTSDFAMDGLVDNGDGTYSWSAEIQQQGGIKNYFSGAGELGDKFTKQELASYMDGVTKDLYGNEVGSVNTSATLLTGTLRGIEAIPYQFAPTVDRRITGSTVGRKYADKILGRMPLLFLTPTEPMFMPGFSKSDKSTVASFLIDKTVEASEDLIEGSGRFYSSKFAYDSYYRYLNCMLNSLAIFMGIGDKKVNVPGYGKSVALRDVDWSKEANSDFKTFFSAHENLVFYVDSLNQVSESFTNETTESSIASQINGFADQSREVEFLFGGKGALSNIVDSASGVLSSVTSALSRVATNIGGGIIGSLAEHGVNTVLNGGKIVFPQIWSDSSFDRSYSIDIKLRSPDNDSISIFMNVLKPYCKILALCLPHQVEDDPNGYSSPFLCRAYCKGLFSIDLGIIASLSVSKGAEGQWNDDGLPTQIDLSVEIKDLYSSLAMSGYDDKIKNVVKNTSYMDFLCNMAGVNIAQMSVGRKMVMWNYLAMNKFTQIPSRLYNSFSEGVSNLIGELYNKI